jgi:D-3-phosphoglycerate dehydrogenase / 2-oxoglutarate reductase
MSVKVLIADKLPDAAIERLDGLDCSVVYDQSLKDDELVEAMREEQPQVVIVRSTKINREMIEATESLGLIIRAGAGYNTIDVQAASERSVYVANCPGKNAVAVAELAMGLLLSIDRRIPDNVAELREGTWNKKEYSQAEGILGKMLGIIGTGRIGQEVIARAKAFGMPVIAWSRSLTPERAEEMGVTFCKSPLDVASQADVISVHLAMTPETKKFIDEKFFSAMKDGAIFLNTSRAEVVDEAALVKAVESKGIRAGLDVFTGEPGGKTGEFTNVLKDKPGVYGTHHIGASTIQAQMAVADEAVNIVREYIGSGHVRNCVNLLEKTPAKYVVSVRHRNRVGVLANVLRVIRDTGINVESMENIIFQGAEGACANIQIDSGLSEEAQEELVASSPDIYAVKINAL